jgi:hypothetical protein
MRPAYPSYLASILLAAATGMTGCGPAGGPPTGLLPDFEAVQPDVFGAAGAQPNAWADFDGDRDLDLFTGFRGRADRLYRNDAGVFVDVAKEMGLGDEEETRAASWGDFDGDGWPDLYVGFAADAGKPNRLYRNEAGTRFTDVAPALGLALTGTTRQVSWVDYDGDGDVDLSIAFRDQPNRLFRNEGGTFTDVTEASGLGDPRKTVGTVWFDMDADGDLDVFVANQDGDTDGMFRNDDGRFTDVAAALDMARPGRAADQGAVGPSLGDYDNDGDLDLFVATYGPNLLYRNEGGGRFALATAEAGLDADYHATPSVWGDYDNDGWLDLYVGSYLRDDPEARDYLYRNEGGRFRDVTPPIVLERGASHGVQWLDFDGDGDLDLALANNHAEAGRHALYRNRLPVPLARRSLQVMVRSAEGRYTVPGAEVRLFRAGTDLLLGTRIVDTGGGYCSQNIAPVHFGLGETRGKVDVEVIVPRAGRRDSVRVDDVDPAGLVGRSLEVRVPAATGGGR